MALALVRPNARDILLRPGAQLTLGRDSFEPPNPHVSRSQVELRRVGDNVGDARRLC